MKAILLGLFSLYIILVSRAEELPRSGNNNNGPTISEELTDLKLQMETMEKELQKLKTNNEKQKIAFSASLFDGKSKQLGPFNTAIAIVYPDIRTNVGNCFNVHTGIFTATVKGVYYFSYTAYTAHSINTFVSLTKNEKTVASLWDTDQHDTNDSGSNSAVLQLEVGDSVYMKLHENKQLFDDSARYNSFSGFLLFPL
ncbi:UNVERIFIED_CONTAM: hypothetical protein FKN15_007032 [Acipenser sinensis]